MVVSITTHSFFRLGYQLLVKCQIRLRSQDQGIPHGNCSQQILPYTCINTTYGESKTLHDPAAIAGRRRPRIDSHLTDLKKAKNRNQSKPKTQDRLMSRIPPPGNGFTKGQWKEIVMMANKAEGCKHKHGR